MASVSSSILVPAPQPEVWSLLSDVTNATRWNKAWKRVELSSNQTHGIGTRFVAHTEDGGEFEFEIDDWSAPDRLSVKPLRDPLEPTYPVMLDFHEFRLCPANGDGEATLLELRANATAHGIKGHLIARLIWPGHQREGLEAALANIAEVFEPGAGEPEDPADPLTD